MGVIIDGKVGALKEALYAPTILDSGDLEPGGNVIVKVAEDVGLANADYAVTLTIPKPADDRFTVLSIAQALCVDVGAFVAPGDNLFCRVYIDSQDLANLVFDEWFNVVALHQRAYSYPATSAPIFALLSDGLPHTFYFFFWTGGLGITIGQVQLLEGVGSDNAVGITEVLTFDGIRGFATVSGLFAETTLGGGGGASIYTYIYSPKGATYGEDVITVGPTVGSQPLSLVEGGGNWFNARPVHVAGSIGIALFPSLPFELAAVKYIRFIWNETE